MYIRRYPRGGPGPGCPGDREDDGEPLRRTAGAPLDYAAMAQLARERPEQVADYVAGRLCDDDMAPFARELSSYLEQEGGVAP